MEENNVKVEVNGQEMPKETASATVTEVPKKSIKDTIKGSWLWKNRGKVGFVLGGALMAVVGAVFGGKDDDGNGNPLDIPSGNDDE